MKTLVTVVSTLKDQEGKDVVFNVLLDAEQNAAEATIMSQPKIRIALDDGGVLYIRQEDARVVTFRNAEGLVNEEPSETSNPRPVLVPEVMAEA